MARRREAVEGVQSFAAQGKQGASRETGSIMNCRAPSELSSAELSIPDLRTREGAERELKWLQTWQPSEGD